MSAGEAGKHGIKNLPAIGQHNNVAPHLSEENLAQRDAVSVVPPITMKHEHRRSRCGKLRSIQSASRKRGTP